MKSVVFVLMLLFLVWNSVSFAGVSGTARKLDNGRVAISGLSISGPADYVGSSGVFAGDLGVVYIDKKQIWQGHFGNVNNSRNCSQSYVASQLPRSITLSPGATFSRDQPTSLRVYCLVGTLEYDWIGPGNPLDDPADCSLALTPSVLDWSMGTSEAGAPKKTTLKVTCTKAANFQLQTDGSSANSGGKTLGTGVNMAWKWENGVPTTANPENVSNLIITPTTAGAAAGQYQGNLMIIVNIQ